MKTNLPKNPSRITTNSVIPTGARRSGGTPAFCYCRCLFSTVVCLFFVRLSSQAQSTQPATREIHIAADADLQPVLPALAEAFTHATGIHLVAQYGTPASHTSQMLAGGPADLFLATDCVFPEQIIARGLADSPEPISYARGILVLWARTDSPLQPLTQITLRDPRIQSLAIADPERIAYGSAAVAALHRMKLYDQLLPHFVIADDLAQTAQFVESGKAQLGFMSQITASTPHMKELGSFILVPPIAYPDIRQCAVVLDKSTHRDDAHAFLDWLLSLPIQQALPAYGLNPIQQTPVPHP